jgi:hypothetical protein
MDQQEEASMAKKPTSKGRSTGSKRGAKRGSKSRAVSERRAGGGGRRSTDAGEAFVKLLQSPLVAELVAVAATAALASLAEQGFSGGGGASRGKRAGQAVKAAGKAAAAAVGRRLGTEIDEIRKATKGAKAGAKA